MKKYTRLTAILAMLLVSGSSCDNYLETHSNSIFTEETAFINLDFATKAVFGVYADLTSTSSYDLSMIYFKADNDIEFILGGNDNSRRSVAHYSADDGNSILGSTWNLVFRTIERANICIEELPRSPIWEGEYANEARRLYGEAVTLRALCYYDLISLWGDVPFLIKSTQAGDNFYLPKTDRDEIYEYLIQELKDIEDYVPWMRETHTTERINKAFVKGLRARMALAYAGYSLRNKTHETRRGRHWQEYYKIANDECREIMESGRHQLNPSYENIFRTIHAYSQDLTYGEVIFEIAFGRLISGRTAQALGMLFATNPPDPLHGRANSEIRTSMHYYYSFDTKDLRRNTNVELYNYASTSFPGQQRLVANTGFGLSKWRRNWITPSMGGDLRDVQFTGINWPLMRYSDIVLMFAESENELYGPTEAAQQALASVRQRAFAPADRLEKVTGYVNSVAASKEAFFKAIVDERAWELGGEMIRKNDLVRWNLLYTKIKEMKDESLKIMSNDPKYHWVPDYIFWRHKDSEVIEILNPDYRLPGTAIEGYTRTNWFPLSSAGNITTFTNTLNIVANGLSETKNNHLAAIPATIIGATNGVLTNDQIP